MILHLTRNRIFALVFLLFATIFCIALIACTSNDPAPQQNQTLFQYLPSPQTGIHFTNQINETVDRNIGMYDYFYNGAGVACGDFDNDGLTDIFLPEMTLTITSIKIKAGFNSKIVRAIHFQSCKPGQQASPWSI